MKTTGLASLTASSLAVILLASSLVAGNDSSSSSGESRVDLSILKNPVWSAEKYHLRDPSVLKTKEGYLVFYSLRNDPWGEKNSWSVASAFTKDFVHFENDHDISAKGFASPGDVIFWHGRYILPYQNYPTSPARLYFSESTDLKTWSEPKRFLEAANKLPWNTQGRVIDPTFVVDGDTLHCFFVGSAKRNVPGGKANLIGHATTKDPNLREWKILTTEKPMIEDSDRVPDGAENMMVFKTGDHWTMIYSEGLMDQHLAIATSGNLIDWKLEGPIDIGKQGWLSVKYGAPFVWRDGDRWLMILMGEDAKRKTTFGLLSSPDGKNWTLLPEKQTL